MLITNEDLYLTTKTTACNFSAVPGAEYGWYSVSRVSWARRNILNLTISRNRQLSSVDPLAPLFREKLLMGDRTMYAPSPVFPKSFRRLTTKELYCFTIAPIPRVRKPRGFTNGLLPHFQDNPLSGSINHFAAQLSSAALPSVYPAVDGNTAGTSETLSSSTPLPRHKNTYKLALSHSPGLIPQARPKNGRTQLDVY